MNPQRDISYCLIQITFYEDAFASLLLWFLGVLFHIMYSGPPYVFLKKNSPEKQAYSIIYALTLGAQVLGGVHLNLTNSQAITKSCLCPLLSL